MDNSREPDQPISEDERKRKYLRRILKDLKDQIFTDTTERIFRDVGLVPPYDFKQISLCKAAVAKDEQEEYIVSGIGNPQSLIDWLEQNKFVFEVKKFKI